MTGDIAFYKGTSVSNNLCISITSYQFSVSDDGLVLTGRDLSYSLDLNWKRLPSQQCFVGAWVHSGWKYYAHIAADIFPESGGNKKRHTSNILTP